MQNSNNKIQVKSLGIYTEDKEQKQQLYVTIPKEKNEFEKLVSSARQVAFEYIDKFSEQKERAVHFYETGVAHSRSTLDYIRSETNIVPKFTFISLSAALGYIFTFRRSRLRRFAYATLFATGATAICYPHEAKQYTGCAYVLTRDKTKALYHDFIMPKSPEPTKQQQGEEKDKIIVLKPSSTEATKKIVGDKGQSHDDDKDMYTTRK